MTYRTKIPQTIVLSSCLCSCKWWTKICAFIVVLILCFCIGWCLGLSLASQGGSHVRPHPYSPGMDMSCYSPQIPGGGFCPRHPMNHTAPGCGVQPHNWRQPTPRYLKYCQTSRIRRQIHKLIHWNQVLNREWGSSWSNWSRAYIWVSNKLIVY